MKCPQCGVWANVKETRNRADYTYRRYECGNQHRFTSNEIVVPESSPKADPKRLLAALKLAAKPTPALDV